MIDIVPLLRFVGASTLVVLMPGADSLLLLRVTLGAGVRAGVLTLVGIYVATALQAALTVCGVGLALVGVPHALDVLHVFGGLYLAYLAWECLGAAARSRGARRSHRASTRTRLRASLLLTGFLADITNPKSFLFFLAFLPQFIGGATSEPLQLAVLSAIFILMALTWEGTIVLGAGRLTGMVHGPRLSAVMNIACAAVFISLAVTLLAAVPWRSRG